MGNSEVEAFFSSGGARAVKWENIGDSVKGIIMSSEVRDQTDMQGNVKRFPDGNPMKQVVITLMTDPPLHEDEDDDGMRRVFVKSQMTAAMKDALRKAGVPGPADGGKLAVKFIREDPPKTRGFNPTKVFQVWYEEPVRRTDMDGPFDDVPPPDDENPF